MSVAPPSKLTSLLWAQALKVVRRLGIFRFCRWRFRNHLRILCYHGFDPLGESMFTDIFMTPARFRQRMNWLKSEGYRVMSLGAATELLKSGNLPRDSVVLTIDDGFYSTYKYAVPILQEVGFTATIYVTTYYVTHPYPIFRLAVQHMFHDTSLPQDLWSGVLENISGLTLPRGLKSQDLLWTFIQYAEESFDEQKRQWCLAQLGESLGLDWQELSKSRRLSLMSPEEIRALSAAGFDIQLHTHRHRFPPDSNVMQAEIIENKEVLEPLTGKPLEHFCYPSGVWSPQQFDTLRDLGIKSATTCDALLNGPGQSVFSLKRFCDCDHLTPIDFEAALTGFRIYTIGLLKMRMWFKERFGL